MFPNFGKNELTPELLRELARQSNSLRFSGTPPVEVSTFGEQVNLSLSGPGLFDLLLPFIEEREDKLAALAPPSDEPTEPCFPAKITDYDGYAYSWVEQEALEDGTFIDIEEGRSGGPESDLPALERNGVPNVPIGATVWLEADEFYEIYWFDSPQLVQLITVDLMAVNQFGLHRGLLQKFTGPLEQEDDEEIWVKVPTGTTPPTGQVLGRWVGLNDDGLKIYATSDTESSTTTDVNPCGCPEVLHLLHKTACIVNPLVDVAFRPLVIDSAQNLDHYAKIQPSGPHDKFQQVINLQAGTYNFTVDGLLGPNNGIVTWAIDDAPFAVQDWYAASVSRNIEQTASVTVAAGRHVLSGTITGANPANTSGHYDIPLADYWFNACPQVTTGSGSGAGTTLCCPQYDDFGNIISDATLPCCFKVTVTGFAEIPGTPFGNDIGCADVNGVYYIQYTGTLSDNHCVWTDPDIFITHALQTAQLSIVPNGEGGWQADIKVGSAIANTAYVVHDLALTGPNEFITDPPNYSDYWVRAGGCQDGSIIVEAIDCDSGHVIPEPCGPCEAVPALWVASLGATATDPTCQAIFSTAIEVTHVADCTWQSQTSPAIYVCGIYNISVTITITTAVTFNVIASSLSGNTTIATYTLTPSTLYDCMECIALNRTLPTGSGAQPDSLSIATWPETLQLCPGGGGGGTTAGYYCIDGSCAQGTLTGDSFQPIDGGDPVDVSGSTVTGPYDTSGDCATACAVSCTTCTPATGTVSVCVPASPVMVSKLGDDLSGLGTSFTLNLNDTDFGQGSIIQDGDCQWQSNMYTVNGHQYFWWVVKHANGRWYGALICPSNDNSTEFYIGNALLGGAAGTVGNCSETINTTLTLQGDATGPSTCKINGTC